MRDHLSVDQTNRTTRRQGEGRRRRFSPAETFEERAGDGEAAFAAELRGHDARGKRGRRIGETGDEPPIKPLRIDLGIEGREIGQCAEGRRGHRGRGLLRGGFERGADLLRLARVRIVRATAMSLPGVEAEVLDREVPRLFVVRPVGVQSPHQLAVVLREVAPVHEARHRAVLIGRRTRRTIRPRGDGAPVVGCGIDSDGGMTRVLTLLQRHMPRALPSSNPVQAECENTRSKSSYK